MDNTDNTNMSDTNQTIHEYYLHQLKMKNETHDAYMKLDPLVKLRNNLIEVIDKGLKSYNYGWVYEDKDYEFDNIARKNVVINESLLKVVQYIESQGLKYRIDVKLLNCYGKCENWDDKGMIVIYWE